MSASFTGAPFLTQSAPLIVAYPFTIAFWAWPNTVAISDPFALKNTGGDEYYELQVDGTNWNFIAGDSTSDANCIAAAYTNNAWQYVVCRAISATNRRITVLRPTGVSVHAQNTTSKTETPNTFNIGTFASGVNPWNGYFAEFWYTLTDIQPGGAQLGEFFLRQLAYEGPFSQPQLVDDIHEYRSFQIDPILNIPEHTYFGGRGPRVWTSSNGTVGIGPHPPLLTSYKRPLDMQRLMVT